MAADAERVGARVHGVDVGDPTAVEVGFQQLRQATRGAAHRFVIYIATLVNPINFNHWLQSTSSSVTATWTSLTRVKPWTLQR